MPDTGTSRPVATLWQLSLNDEHLSCTVHRTPEGFELRVASASAVILSEQVDLDPRTVARSQALRASLKRRGWRES